jgi:hypothetical protein
MKTQGSHPVLSFLAMKLSAISYELLHILFCSGNISAPWVTFVKDILDNCGLSNVWTFQNINFNTEQFQILKRKHHSKALRRSEKMHPARFSRP